MAIANRIARAIYHILADSETRYKELGALKKLDDERQIKNALRRLKALGVEVNFHTHHKIVDAKKTIEMKA